MALPKQPDSLAVADYLKLDRESDVRHEYLLGQVYAMAGANERHNQISAALGFLLYGQLLDKSCQMFQNDMKVQVSESIFFYPDTLVVCGSPNYKTEIRDILLNPTVIIEILSASTQDYDRGRKFKHYRTLKSLTDYLLIAQDQYLIEHHQRQTNATWLLTEYSQIDSVVEIESIDCALKLQAIYRDISFDE